MEEWCSLKAFTAEVQTGLLNMDDVEQIDREIEFAAGMLVDAAECLLPLVHPIKGQQDGGMIFSVHCVHRADQLVQLGRRLVVHWRVRSMRLRWVMRRRVRFCAAQAKSSVVLV